MDTKKIEKEEIIALAEKTKRYCDLLIEQSDNWLSEKEGFENIKKKLSGTGTNASKIKNISKNKTIRIVIGILLSASFASTIYGQNADDSDCLEQETRTSRLDSLLSRLSTVEAEDTTTALLYRDIGEEYELSGKNDSARCYYLKLRDLSDRLNFNNGYFAFVTRYTDILIKKGVPDSILIINRKRLELAQQMGDHEIIAASQTNIGIGYHLKGYFETALSHYLEALNYYESVSDIMAIGQLCDMIQAVHWETEHYKEAVMYGEKATNLLSRGDDPYLYSISLLNLSNTYLDMYPSQRCQAKECLDKALTIAKENGYAYIEVNAYINQCRIACFTDVKESEMYARRALEMGIEMDDPEIIALSQNNMGYASFYFGRYKEAEEWLQQALELAQEYDYKYIMTEVYKKLARLSYALQQHRQGLIFDHKSDSVKNLLTNEKILHATEELKVKYETEKKEHKIARQTAFINRQKIYQAALSGGLLFSIAFLTLLWYILHLRTKRNRALTEMNATKDRFFSIISHDLKNPAIAQREALQLLINHAKNWDVEMLTNYYNELLKSADNQVELLYNLLNWAQVQTGRMPYHPVSLDVSTELRTDLSLLTYTAQRKKIHLEINIPENTILFGDRNMIITVIRNLLTNAVKFTQPGGVVSLQIETGVDDKHTCSIYDTGRGMSAEQIQNLFHIDRRHSSKGTAGEQGNGLGLIVCKELLERHGSLLQVESAPGKGCHFWFIL